MRTAEEKVPGGKLARVSVGRDGRVEISGDFFAHPEEGIALLENALRRLDGTWQAAEIERLLYSIIEESNLELIGVDVPAIARLYQRCLTCGE